MDRSDFFWNGVNILLTKKGISALIRKLNHLDTHPDKIVFQDSVTFTNLLSIKPYAAGVT